jgi:hypothetical protein
MPSKIATSKIDALPAVAAIFNQATAKAGTSLGPEPVTKVHTSAGTTMAARSIAAVVKPMKK